MKLLDETGTSCKVSLSLFVLVCFGVATGLALGIFSIETFIWYCVTREWPLTLFTWDIVSILRSSFGRLLILTCCMSMACGVFSTVPFLSLYGLAVAILMRGTEIAILALAGIGFGMSGLSWVAMLVLVLEFLVIPVIVAVLLIVIFYGAGRMKTLTPGRPPVVAPGLGKLVLRSGLIFLFSLGIIALIVTGFILTAAVVLGHITTLRGFMTAIASFNWPMEAQPVAVLWILPCVAWFADKRSFMVALGIALVSALFLFDSARLGLETTFYSCARLRFDLAMLLPYFVSLVLTFLVFRDKLSVRDSFAAKAAT